MTSNQVIEAVLNAEKWPSICPLFSSGMGVNVSHPRLSVLVCLFLILLFISLSLRLALPPILTHPLSFVCLLLYLLPLALPPPLTSTPHRAVTILRENPFLFTQIITSLLLVIEPGCLVNGIVLEYNTVLNGAMVDREQPEVALKLSGCCTVL